MSGHGPARWRRAIAVAFGQPGARVAALPGTGGGSSISGAARWLGRIGAGLLALVAVFAPLLAYRSPKTGVGGSLASAWPQ